MQDVSLSPTTDTAAADTAMGICRIPSGVISLLLVVELTERPVVGRQHERLRDAAALRRLRRIDG